MTVASRLVNGVPGNFHWHEAPALCEAAGMPELVGHDIGMFAFNTVDQAVPHRATAANATGVVWRSPRPDVRLEPRRDGSQR